MSRKVVVIGTVSEYLDSGMTMEQFAQFKEFLNGRKFTRWLRKNEKNLAKLALLGVLAFFPDPVFAQGVATGFFKGQGAILLHMLIVGFLTLVITTFLKFTGRGDLGPLVVFVGGGIILYETLGLFQLIYQGIVNFFNM